MQITEIQKSAIVDLTETFDIYLELEDADWTNLTSVDAERLIISLKGATALYTFGLRGDNIWVDWVKVSDSTSDTNAAVNPMTADVTALLKTIGTDDATIALRHGSAIMILYRFHEIATGELYRKQVDCGSGFAAALSAATTSDSQSASEALAAVGTAFIHAIQHVTPRRYELGENGEFYEDIEAETLAEALEQAVDNVSRAGYVDFVADYESFETDVFVREIDENGHQVERDDEKTYAATTVHVEAEEPDCDSSSGHSWVSPHEVLGGLEDNPGVLGVRGGVATTEICRHCGWYLDKQYIEQSMSTKYREADDASLAYSARQKVDVDEVWYAFRDGEFAETTVGDILDDLSDDEIPDMVEQFDEASIVIGKRTYFPTAADAARNALESLSDVWYSVADGEVVESTVAEIASGLGNELLVGSAEELAGEGDVVTIGDDIYYREAADAEKQLA